MLRSRGMGCLARGNTASLAAVKEGKSYSNSTNTIATNLRVSQPKPNSLQSIYVGLKAVPFKKISLSAACEAVTFLQRVFRSPFRYL